MKPVTPILPGIDLPISIYAETQPEYQNFPLFKYPDGDVLSRWRLTWKERIKILFTGNVYLYVSTFNRSLQPIMLQVDKPKMDPLRCLQTKEQILKDAVDHFQSNIEETTKEKR